MALQGCNRLITVPFILLNATSRHQHVLFVRKKIPSDNNELVVFFGGDIQDFAESMKSDPNKKEFVNWSLENVGELLYHKFPNSDILAVRPCRYDHGTFSCYDNFVPSQSYGIPKFVSNHGALMHLNELLVSLSTAVQTSDLEGTRYEEARLSLIGFSKGCVVLNQLLHEFHFADENSQSQPVMVDIIRKISSMYFLDGGHAGKNNTWITNQSLLQTLAKLGINVFVHVTPYQVNDERRPWIGKEEELFAKTLKNFQARIYRKLHFKNDPPSLQNHFQVLKEFQPM
ncbi:mitochondrial protein C2orf69 homolog [Planococcus citri]|uniref:mitochondrial protein C2orf69 homolog n=1 Tax=Planococcus citri TaxID=170843 RepID=UPI0031F83A03